MAVLSARTTGAGRSERGESPCGSATPSTSTASQKDHHESESTSVLRGVTGCYFAVTDAVTTATALTPRVPAVTPRVTPRPMLPLCNSDRVTTPAYVTRGPARPRPNLLRNAPDNK